MIYRIKEKFWSFGDEFIIKNENDEPCYIVKGQAFSWGDKLSLQDLEGNELSFISQKLMSFKPKYEIYIKGELFAEVRKEFSWFKKVFTLDIPGPNDYQIEGSFWKHDYTFTRQEGVVATVSKKMFSWSDSYAIKTVDGEDDISILSACIVIDQIIENERD